MKEHLSYDEVEVATRGFALDMLLGKGSHGCVYKGVLENGNHVAVKKPSSRTRSLSEEARLGMEIEILSSINSPRLINLVGVCHKEREKLIVMEYMPNGSLHDLLHASPVPLPWSRRLLVALHIAQAVQALHESTPPIIHRDIKSSNILFDSGWNAKLADFSLAVRQADLPSSAPSPAGTIGYLDPSYTGPGKLSPKNDIFSYGVVLLELISGRHVMDAAYETTSIVAWAEPLLSSGLVAEVCDPRLALSYTMRKIINHLLKTAARCILPESEKRPSAGEIAKQLQVIIEYLQLSIWGYLKNNFYGRIFPRIISWAKRRQSKITATRIVCTDHLYDEDDPKTDYPRSIDVLHQVPLQEPS